MEEKEVIENEVAETSPENHIETDPLQDMIRGKLKMADDTVDKDVDVSDVIEKEVAFDYESHVDNTNTTAEVEEDEEEPKRKPLRKINLDNITILEGSTVLDKEQDLKNALFGGKAAFQIVAAQSGYLAKVIPLVHKDVVSLLSSNLSRYEYRKAVFKVIYDKVVAISSYPTGKPAFDEWLKITSVEDIETFYYGIYCATFPNEGTFSFVCPDCGQERTIKINHNNLFKTTNKDKMKKLIREVSKNAMSKEAMQRYSLVGKSELLQLEDSKIIMDLRTPSLWDSLEILRVVPERVIDRDTTSVTDMLYIKRFLIPAKGRDGFTEQTDSQELLRIIDNLSIDDAAALQDTVSDRVDENRITYSIKNIQCPNCKYKAEETPISIEDILFTLIFEKAQ